MNNIPWFSIFTLITETFVTTSVLYVFYWAYKENKFNYKLTAVTLAYEIFFNIGYMVSRVISHKESVSNPESTPGLILAIFHGIFSLIMFIALLVFMYVAWKNYRKGVNFFREHKKLSTVFLIAWMIAVLSGFLFFYEEYLAPSDEIQTALVSMNNRE